ncbi:fimbrial protein [Serratia sp. (in: enterobacteria)]|uniref:fimbrial protein n=1 Tax=Serratia sp. (in: enterobacteria) TaxID=616 RepID=UPI0039891C49
MNKNLIAIAVLAASAFSTSAFAAGGKVYFTGEIIDKACTIETDVDKMTVKLGKIHVGEFGGASDVTAGSLGFNVILKDCPESVTQNGAAVRFAGTQVNGNGSVLALTNEPDVATGVGIQIADDQGSVINLHKDSRVYQLSSTEDNLLGFVASYYSTSANIVAGKANAVSDFSISYK